jgi:ParB-like chromosome segregation protein Spo0J
MLMQMKEICVDFHNSQRGVVTESMVLDLAKDIAANGQREAILVKRYDQGVYLYKLVSGYRRFVAMAALGKTEIEAQSID